MTEPKDIANYYIDRYRKMIGFANKALSVALLILVTNWIFSIEPGYQAINISRQTYKKQLQETEKQLTYFTRLYFRYFNKNAVDSETYIANLRLQNLLQEAIDRCIKTDKSGSECVYLEDSLDHIETAIYQYRRDSSNRSMITLLQDSISHVKRKRIDLEQAKTTTLNENLGDYDWKSLIKFIFIVAGNPKDGSLYLMGLVSLILIFGLISKRIGLRYLAKGLRIYKTDDSLGLNPYQDFSIPTPFWLSPLPLSKKILNKSNEEDKTNNITQNDLHNILGYSNNVIKFTLLTLFILLSLLLLQLRFFYISLHANTSIHFDFSFTIAIILLLMSTGQILVWMHHFQIDDRLNYESASDNKGRRLFITYGVLTVAAIILIKSRNKISKFYNLNAKRYISKRRYNEFRNSKIVNYEGLYFRSPNLKDSKKRKIVYFFDSNRYSLTLRLVVNTKQLNAFQHKLIGIKNTDFSPQNLYRFNENQFSWHTEHYTLALLKQGKEKEAVDFIFGQITSSNPDILYDYRIPDLATKMFVRLDNTNTYLNKFLSFLDQRLNDTESLLSNDLIIIERFNKWRSEKWLAKVKSRQYVVYNNVRF